MIVGLETAAAEFIDAVLLPHAGRDPLTELQEQLLADAKVAKVADGWASEMRRLFDGAADQKSASFLGGGELGLRLLSGRAFVATLGERGALRAVHVRQQSEVTADPAAKRALELRAFDRQAKLAFLECALARRFDWLQTAHGPPAAAGAPAMPILDYTGFVECLLLCSQLRYEALGPKFERSARASAFLPPSLARPTSRRRCVTPRS